MKNEIRDYIVNLLIILFMVGLVSFALSSIYFWGYNNGQKDALKGEYKYKIEVIQDTNYIRIEP